MALDPVAQQLDFSLGAFRSGALEREPEGAAETILGCIGDDGLPFRRGGAVYETTGAAGSGGVTWVYDGALLGGRATLMGGPAALYWENADRSVSVVTGDQFPQPVCVVARRGQAYVEPPETTGHTVTSIRFGGSRKATYTTGTVSFTNGDDAVVGAGTSWLANAEPGMLFTVSGVGTAIVARVVDNTHLTLQSPWAAGSDTGRAYTLSAVVSAAWDLPAPVYLASVVNRIVRCYGQQIDFSGVEDDTYAPLDYHSFPESVRGAAALRDVLVVFTDGGVWSISNMAYPIVDPATGDSQHRKELVNGDMILWDRRGVADWNGALVVPTLDNVYVMDSLGAPTPIGDRILDLYLSYIAAGHKCGRAATLNGEYVLPILNSSNGWVDTLVCRLRSTHSGTTFGWSQLSGMGAELAGVAERASSPPKLLGASLRSSSRVLDVTGFFVPVQTLDPDGSSVPAQLTTVDYPTGNSVENFVHKVRLRYSLGSGSIGCEVSFDGGAWQALSDVADPTKTEKVWRASGYGRNVRFRFTGNAAGLLTFKSVEVFVRHSGRQ